MAKNRKPTLTSGLVRLCLRLLRLHFVRSLLVSMPAMIAMVVAGYIYWLGYFTSALSHLGLPYIVASQFNTLFFGGLFAASLVLIALGWRELARRHPGLSRVKGTGPTDHERIWPFIWWANLQSTVGAISTNAPVLLSGVLVGVVFLGSH